MGDIKEFAIMHVHQQLHFKVTSNSINFAIKDGGGASVGLGRSLKSCAEYKIIFDASQCTLKHDDQVKETIVIQNDIIYTNDVEEFKYFWMSWNRHSIKLGRKGCHHPVMTHNCKANDMKYVTFFISYRRLPSLTYFKVELPPVMETPVFKSISSGALRWVPINADTEVLPDGCLVGGYENEIIYIIRAKHRGSLTPGKFVPSEGCAYISWGGEMHQKSAYEVLCGYDCTWVQTTKDVIPVGAVVAGYSEDIEHEKLYVGRAKYANYTIPGKVQPSHQVCYIPCDDREIAEKNYEILVVSQQDTYTNTLLVPHVEDNAGIDTADDDDDGHYYWGGRDYDSDD